MRRSLLDNLETWNLILRILYRQSVGRDVTDSHRDIPPLAADSCRLRDERAAAACALGRSAVTTDPSRRYRRPATGASQFTFYVTHIRAIVKSH
ncbi:hypothetical protein EVAR_53379_1 [Eumeta japonica]|uniref:Uncharacterized protein n=1 Tax=Eumeta variegata TaxID=151549 RepID=A0A4C1Y928_EUMVA|nr:hypothetical protein EVAR_53379_1 [Eumeta japonica]